MFPKLMDISIFDQISRRAPTLHIIDPIAMIIIVFFKLKCVIINVEFQSNESSA
jgi:hypothetical protein